MPTEQSYVGGDSRAKHTEGTVKSNASTTAQAPLTAEERAILNALLSRVTTPDEQAQLRIIIDNPSLVKSDEAFFNPLKLTPEEVDARYNEIGGVLPQSNYAVNLSVNCGTPDGVVRVSVFETLVFAVSDYLTYSTKRMAECLRMKDAKAAHENNLNVLNCQQLMMDLALGASLRADQNQDAHGMRNVGELRYKQSALISHDARFEELDEFAQE